MNARTHPMYLDPVAWTKAIYRKRMAVFMVASNPQQFRRTFIDWLVPNWHVWEAFEHEADRVWSRGTRHYSARTIGEFLRHKTAVEEAANQWGVKIDNNTFPDLARLYMLLNPDRDRFFEKRVSPMSVRAV